MTKIKMVLAIVDWEHRYLFGRLVSGGWAIARIEQLMKRKKTSVKARYENLFGK